MWRAERLREEHGEDGMGMGNGYGEPFKGRCTWFFGVSEGGGGKSVANGDMYQGNEAHELCVVGGIPMDGV